jgi:hypothetical protein
MVILRGQLFVAKGSLGATAPFGEQSEPDNKARRELPHSSRLFDRKPQAEN